MYIDDILVAGTIMKDINKLKNQMSNQFAMKDLETTKQIIEMRIIWDKANGTMKISQAEYVKKVLKRFSMEWGSEHTLGKSL